jgi:hypothetical protein
MRVSLLLNFVVAFFIFGTAMCLLTILLLAKPGSILEPLWRLNPEAHRAFVSMGVWAFVAMTIVGIACAAAASGVALRREWGRRLAVAVFTVNLVGDGVNAALGDLRTLIGLPISAMLIAVLMNEKVRACFRLQSRQHG